MKKIIFLIILVVAGAIAYLCYRWYDSPEASDITIESAKITDVKPLLRLCTVEIYDEVPIKAAIGPRHIFAKTSLNGSISFDLENISYDETPDTIRMILPREIIDIYESTDPGAYKVYDRWNDNLFGSSHFTATEENKIKMKVRDNYRKSIYRRGLVKRARKEATDALTDMLSSITGKTVIVTDTVPEGLPD